MPVGGQEEKIEKQRVAKTSKRVKAAEQVAEIVVKVKRKEKGIMRMKHSNYHNQ